MLNLPHPVFLAWYLTRDCYDLFSRLILGISSVHEIKTFDNASGHDYVLDPTDEKRDILVDLQQIITVSFASA